MNYIHVVWVCAHTWRPEVNIGHFFSVALHHMCVYTHKHSFLCMHVFPAHAHLCIMCMPNASGEAKKGCQISWEFRQLWATMWVLEIEPQSSARGMSALNHCAISPDPPLTLAFWDRVSHWTCSSLIHLGWLSNELPVSFWLYLHSTEATGHHHTQLLHGFWVYELRL